MQRTIFLAMLAAASLFACGKPEEAPVPVAPTPAADTPQAESLPVTVPEPRAPAVETAPVAQPEAVPVTPPVAAATTAKPAPEPKSSSEVAPSAPKSDLAHGQQIYRQACAFCHDKGVAGAPAIGDAAAWSPRLAQGMDALYASAMGGKGAMPARGGNPALADNDVKAAVDFLAAQAR
jgi:cytochrome c5